MDNAKIYFTENGALQSILYASQMVERNKITYGMEIKVDFFKDKDTIPDGGMTADSGFVNEGKGRNRIVTVLGDVHLISPDGVELFADSLRWNPRNQQIESESKVKIINGNEVIEGTGFMSDAGFQKIRLKQVKGQMSSDRL